jgi:hypothetical protein
MRKQGFPRNPPITTQKALRGQWESGDSAPFVLSLRHGRLPLEGGDLLLCHELFHSLYRPRLMLLGRMGIPEDHLNLGMAK